MIKGALQLVSLPPIPPQGRTSTTLVRGKLTSPTPSLQETGPTVLRPIREDKAM